ncbi:c-type cytochrome [Granulosicoccus antarcticus]|uniref:Nitric oxide reductase subunit C n=1 Tax=Granulosicoccus antarcticus IMCC3135 TaxID=1192854 RepID=A0A2Z2NV54_9GAMM|nr:cytochrome c [Granulosicoccus antarcticus]ASJ73598.1 Nitric oxide reductase subunit C [Granulosicoccus antarcticus IMCC3135]
MNKRQTRLFAIGSTLLAVVIFVGMTIDSHRQFGKLTNADKITAEVKLGQNVWHDNNCINCHTLFGEGAYYAPDLTKITQHRGEAYLKAYMRDPSQFYDEQKDRRLMPNQDLSEDDITNLIAFLDWVSNVDNGGWPPRPILVTGAGMPGGAPVAVQTPTTDDATGSSQNAELNPIALGEQVFKTTTPACGACHSIVPGVDMAGPSLAGIASRSEKMVASSDYTGQATDLQSYLHESIVSPGAYLVPGAMYSADGTSFMPPGYAMELTTEQVDQLVAYLSSLK